MNTNWKSTQLCAVKVGNVFIKISEFYDIDDFTFNIQDSGDGSSRIAEYDGGVRTKFRAVPRLGILGSVSMIELYELRNLRDALNRVIIEREAEIQQGRMDYRYEDEGTDWSSPKSHDYYNRVTMW